MVQPQVVPAHGHVEVQVVLEVRQRPHVGEAVQLAHGFELGCPLPAVHVVVEHVGALATQGPQQIARGNVPLHLVVDAIGFDVRAVLVVHAYPLNACRHRIGRILKDQLGRRLGLRRIVCVEGHVDDVAGRFDDDGVGEVEDPVVDGREQVFGGIEHQAEVPGGGGLGAQLRVAGGVHRLEGTGGRHKLQGSVAAAQLIEARATEAGADGAAQGHRVSDVPTGGQFWIQRGAHGAAVVLVANGRLHVDALRQRHLQLAEQGEDVLVGFEPSGSGQEVIAAHRICRAVELERQPEALRAPRVALTGLQAEGAGCLGEVGVLIGNDLVVLPPVLHAGGPAHAAAAERNGGFAVEDQVRNEQLGLHLGADGILQPVLHPLGIVKLRVLAAGRRHVKSRMGLGNRIAAGEGIVVVAVARPQIAAARHPGIDVAIRSAKATVGERQAVDRGVVRVAFAVRLAVGQGGNQADAVVQGAFQIHAHAKLLVLAEVALGVAGHAEDASKHLGATSHGFRQVGVAGDEIVEMRHAWANIAFAAKYRLRRVGWRGVPVRHVVLGVEELST